MTDAKSHTVVSLNGTYYHYCEIDPNTVSRFLDADSMGRFFNANIKAGSTAAFNVCDYK